ncbi:MAG: ATP-binding protein [Candidatus Heimdallarchaeaceae archaeon]
MKLKEKQLFELSPALPNKNELIFGDSRERRNDLCLVGEAAEFGPKKQIKLDISGEHVIAIVGKRGSGKSYTLGSIIESLATAEETSKISSISEPRGVLLFDTLDIYWTTKYPLFETDNEKIKRQYEIMKRFGLEPEKINVELWIPNGFIDKDIDVETINIFQLNTSDLEPDDWSILFEIDLIDEPRGHLIYDVYQKVKKTGWHNDGEFIKPKTHYSLRDIIECLTYDEDLQNEYSSNTIRSIRQRFQTYDGMGLFSEKGTELHELIKPGNISVLMLGRLRKSVRELIATVLFNQIINNRIKASFAKKRLQIDPDLDKTQINALKKKINESIPRTWLAIDEAQNLIPSTTKTKSQDLIVKYVKEGRNYGLSLIITTQQPNAIDSKVMTQVDTMFIHQLSSGKDINYILDNLKSDLPDRISDRKRTLDIHELLRNLSIGNAFVSCTENTTDISRSFVLKVRPRVTIHGGFED